MSLTRFALLVALLTLLFSPVLFAPFPSAVGCSKWAAVMSGTRTRNLAGASRFRMSMIC